MGVQRRGGGRRGIRISLVGILVAAACVAVECLDVSRMVACFANPCAGIAALEAISGGCTRGGGAEPCWTLRERRGKAREVCNLGSAGSLGGVNSKARIVPLCRGTAGSRTRLGLFWKRKGEEETRKEGSWLKKWIRKGSLGDASDKDDGNIMSGDTSNAALAQGLEGDYGEVVEKGEGGMAVVTKQEVGEEEVPVGRPVEEIRLEELATKYGLAVQTERIMQLRKDVFTLEEDLEKEKEKAEWDEFINGLEEEGAGELEGGQPWEVDEDDLYATGLCVDEELESLKRDSYIQLQKKPMNLIGSFEQGGTSESNSSSAAAFATFDQVIAEQKAKTGTISETKAGGDVDLLEEMKSTWRRAEAEVQQEMDDEAVERAMRELEDRIEVRRLIEMSFNSKLAEAEHKKGRAELDGHKLPWGLIEARIVDLQSRILRERFEGVEGTGEERKQAMDAAYNKSVAADVLRMPKTGRGASDGAGDVGKGEGQGGGGVPVIEFGDDDIEEMMDLLTPKEQTLVQQIRGEVDLQIQDFREKQEAICFGTEELIWDKLRWWPKDKHPKYDSVDSFRQYVYEKALEAGDVKNTPWKGIPSLFIDRETAIEERVEKRRELKRRAQERERELAYGGSMYDEQSWAEVEEIAEDEWRFYDPEQYYRFEKLRERRREMLEVQRTRSEKMMRISAEAEVSLDEYMGVMIDFGLCSPGNNTSLLTADVGLSPISGKGREFGLDGDLERQILKSMVLTYVSIILSPVAVQVGNEGPELVQRAFAELRGFGMMVNYVAATAQHVANIYGGGGGSLI